MPDSDDTPEVVEAKLALEKRGKIAGIDVDRRKSLDDIKKEVEAAEKIAAQKRLAAKSEKKETPKLGKYIIPEGQTITTLKGNITGLVSIEAKDLVGGEETFNTLLKGGYIKENKQE